MRHNAASLAGPPHEAHRREHAAQAPVPASRMRILPHLGQAAFAASLEIARQHRQQ